VEADMNDGYFWDGYLHWARDIEEKDPELQPRDGAATELYEPIFIRMNLPFDADLFETIVQTLMDAVAEESTVGAQSAVARIDVFDVLKDLVFDPIELLIAFQHALMTSTSPEFFVYRPVARTQQEHDKDMSKFEILDVGAPARVNLDNQVFNLTNRKFVEDPVIAAVIDNDIGYLNHRFRRSADTTRIEALWLHVNAEVKFPRSAEVIFPTFGIW
jgi:hypothetical protein